MLREMYRKREAKFGGQRNSASAICEKPLVGFMRTDPEPQNRASFALHADSAVITADANGYEGIVREGTLEMKAWMPRIRSEKVVRGPRLIGRFAWQSGEHLSKRSIRP